VKTAEAAPPIPVLGGLDQTSSLQPAAAEFNGFSSQESDSVKHNSEEGEKPFMQEAAEDDDAKTGNSILQKGSSGSSSYSNGEEKLAALETSSSTLEESSLPGWNKLDHSLDESKSDADANGRIAATHDAAAEAAEVEALRSTVHKLREKEQLLEKQLLQYKQQLGLLADDDENVKKKERGDLAAEELAAAARVHQPELKKEDAQTSVEELEIEVAGLRHANKELEQQRSQLSEKVYALQQTSELAHHSKGSILELVRVASVHSFLHNLFRSRSL
jgi:chromosome segregation ATPase